GSGRFAEWSSGSTLRALASCSAAAFRSASASAACCSDTARFCWARCRMASASACSRSALARSSAASASLRRASTARSSASRCCRTASSCRCCVFRSRERRASMASSAAMASTTSTATMIQTTVDVSITASLSRQAYPYLARGKRDGRLGDGLHPDGSARLDPAACAGLLREDDGQSLVAAALLHLQLESQPTDDLLSL